MNRDLAKAYSKYGWDTHGFIGVFIALIAIFLIIPLFMKSFYSFIMLQVCFIGIVLSAMHAVRKDHFSKILTYLLILPFLGLGVLGIVKDSWLLMLASYSFYCTFLGIAIFFLSKKVFSMPVMDTNLIFATITIYFLLGILWSKLYFIIHLMFPGSFHGIEQPALLHDSLVLGYQNQFDLLYFSFTTLTTLGVGDIIPVHHLAKSLTVLEALFGQLFVATIIAKVVSIWRG